MDQKSEVLKQIDEATSRFGDKSVKTNSRYMRDIGAKKTASRIMERKSLLRQQNLDKLTSSQMETAAKYSEAGRSIKSEYDYGSKRKFVDVLNNVNVLSSHYLQEKDKLPTSPESERNRSLLNHKAEVQSRKSNYGAFTVKNSLVSPNKNLLPIDEDEELMLVKKNGEILSLNQN